MLNDLITQADQLVSLYLAPGMMTALGLALWRVAYDHTAPLGCYTRARSIMAATFVLYGLALVVEHYAVGASLSEGTMGAPSATQAATDLGTRLTVVAISMSQAYLFTLTLVTLLDVEFLSPRRLRAEAVLPVASTVAAFTAGAVLEGMDVWVLVAYQAAYALLLVRYVRLFRRHYAYYGRLMDNYYSGDAAERLRWVGRSFYWSLAIGVAALAYSTYPCRATSLPFMAVAVAYYTYYALRFINYPHEFPIVEAALVEPAEPTEAQQPTEDELLLLQEMDRLMAEQPLYTDPALTIAQVAVALGRSHRALSAALSHGRQTTFKAYINHLRIQRAQQLIARGWLSRHTIDALATECGFSGRVHFYRIFKQTTSMSPSAYAQKGNTTPET